MPGIEFETPENVQISYQPAGLGHRFIAWLMDQVLVLLVTALLFLVLLLVAALVGTITDDLMNSLRDRFAEAEDQEAAQEVILFFQGIAILVWSFGSFLYFVFSELFLRGQTLGKRYIGVRVVKANGFSLDPLTIFVRNLFRVLDQLPPLWIVPVLSRRGQRFGDMVAGSIVVNDAAPRLCRVREELAGRAALDARFRFDQAALRKLRPGEFDTVEQLLDRWDDIRPPQLQSLLDQLIDPLALRMNVEAPAVTERMQFLEDLLAAEYRRQSRNLA